MPILLRARKVIAAHHKFLAHVLGQNLLPEMEILGSKSGAILGKIRHSLLPLGECLLRVAGQGKYAGC
jgi:hypothetical protein